MAIASRTPEGDPFVCRVCGAIGLIEPSPVTGDAVCPRCGGYVARVLARLDALLPGHSGPVDLEMPLVELVGGDSLDVVELAMTLEDEFGVTLDPDTLDGGETLADLIRLLADRRTDTEGP